LARLRDSENARIWQGELSQLKRWSSHAAIAIDIGANEGLYSYRFAQWFARVEAFEPNPLVVQRLRDYQSSKIKIHEVALSSSLGKACLHVPTSTNGSEEAGWATLDPTRLDAKQFGVSPSIRMLSVPIKTLDSFTFDNVGVIKIDVEGHECDVLAGAEATLRRCRPVVLIEAKNESRFFVEEFFQELNYSLFFWDSYHLVCLSDGLASWNNPHVNLFAIPEEKQPLCC